MHRAPLPSNLEAAASAFIGRESDLANLRDLLARHRLLTLVGPAGVGKTQLALALAREVAGANEAQVWFCDLSEAGTLDELCTCVVQALDIQGAGEDGEAQIERIGRHLERQGPLLLVLDNFEQLVGEAAATLGAWMRAAPRARFVVTSRLRLKLEGECAHRVEPLPASDAEALFVYRVGHLRPGYRVLAEDREVLREVLEELDGLPLAIELAAARMQVMGIRELREHLSSRLTLLTSGRRDAPARQSSLEAALLWSWRQLAPCERSALLQCSRFRGGFDLAAAAAVIDLSSFEGAPSTLDVLSALVDQSMVRARDLPPPIGGRRLSLLRIVRDFVVAQAPVDFEDGDSTRDAARRHATFYAELGEALGERWESRSGLSALPRLGLERENLLAAARSSEAEPHLALRAALGLHPVVGAWGPLRPQLELLEACLSAARRAGLDPRTEARALLSRGRLEIACFGVSAAEKSWAQAAALAARAGDDELEGRARHGLAAVAHTKGQLDEAVQEYGRALERLRVGSSRRACCRALLDLALLHAERGAVHAALDVLDEAAATATEVDDLAGAVLCLRGCLHLDTGALDPARESLRAALEVSRAGAYRLLEGQVLTELAVLSLLSLPTGTDVDRADVDRAGVDRAFEEARAVIEEVGDRRLQCSLSGYRAVTSHLRGELADAVQRYELAQRAAAQLGIERLAELLAAWSAMALADHDRLEAAERRIERAAGGDDPLVGAALDLARAQRDLGRARESFAAGRTSHAATLLSAARARASASGARGELERSSRDLRLTRRLFERALASTAETLGIAEAAGESRARLTVDGAGRWFRIDDDDAPGVPLSKAELVEAVWGGEKMTAESAKNRLHVALSQLRRLGLREQVRTEEGGYLIDPTIDVTLVDEDPAR